MPVINVVCGPMTKKTKKELIESLVDASIKVTGSPEHAHTVIIQEVPLDAISNGKISVEKLISKDNK